MELSYHLWTHKALIKEVTLLPEHSKIPRIKGDCNVQKFTKSEVPYFHISNVTGGLFQGWDLMRAPKLTLPMPNNRGSVCSAQVSQMVKQKRFKKIAWI